MVLLCFYSGRIVITGGKHLNDIYEGWARLWPTVKKFMLVNNAKVTSTDLESSLSMPAIASTDLESMPDMSNKETPLQDTHESMCASSGNGCTD